MSCSEGACGEMGFVPEEKMGFTVKDSGKRQEFSSGMVRDTAEGKIDYTALLDGPMFDRWAAHLTKAKEKYPDIAPGVANWTLANGEEELVRFRKSAFRHFRQWLRGDTDEDHAAAVLFNINGHEYVKARMAEKRKTERVQELNKEEIDKLIQSFPPQKDVVYTGGPYKESDFGYR